MSDNAFPIDEILEHKPGQTTYFLVGATSNGMLVIVGEGSDTIQRIVDTNAVYKDSVVFREGLPVKWAMVTISDVPEKTTELNQNAIDRLNEALEGGNYDE